MEIENSLDITHDRLLRRIEKYHVGSDEQHDHSDNVQNRKQTGF
jgi:hypothetical protein